MFNYQYNSDLNSWVEKVETLNRDQFNWARQELDKLVFYSKCLQGAAYTSINGITDIYPVLRQNNFSTYYFSTTGATGLTIASASNPFAITPDNLITYQNFTKEYGFSIKSLYTPDKIINDPFLNYNEVDLATTQAFSGSVTNYTPGLIIDNTLVKEGQRVLVKDEISYARIPPYIDPNQYFNCNYYFYDVFLLATGPTGAYILPPDLTPYIGFTGATISVYYYYNNNNGVYKYTSGSLVREPDLQTYDSAFNWSGLVKNGTTNREKQFHLSRLLDGYFPIIGTAVTQTSFGPTGTANTEFTEGTNYILRNSLNYRNINELSYSGLDFASSASYSITGISYSLPDRVLFVGEFGTILNNQDSLLNIVYNKYKVNINAVKLTNRWYWFVGDNGALLRMDPLTFDMIRIDLKTFNNLEHVDFINDLRGVVVGQFNSIYYTFDGGKTWRQININSYDNYSYNRCIYYDYNNIYVVGNNGIFFRLQMGISDIDVDIIPQAGHPIDIVNDTLNATTNTFSVLTTTPLPNLSFHIDLIKLLKIEGVEENLILSHLTDIKKYTSNDWGLTYSTPTGFTISNTKDFLLISGLDNTIFMYDVNNFIQTTDLIFFDNNYGDINSIEINDELIYLTNQSSQLITYSLDNAFIIGTTSNVITTSTYSSIGLDYPVNYIKFNPNNNLLYLAGESSYITYFDGTNIFDVDNNFYNRNKKSTFLYLEYDIANKLNFFDPNTNEYRLPDTITYSNIINSLNMTSIPGNFSWIDYYKDYDKNFTMGLPKTDTSKVQFNTLFTMMTGGTNSITFNNTNVNISSNYGGTATLYLNKNIMVLNVATGFNANPGDNFLMETSLTGSSLPGTITTNFILNSIIGNSLYFYSYFNNNIMNQLIYDNQNITFTNLNYYVNTPDLVENINEHILGLAYTATNIPTETFIGDSSGNNILGFITGTPSLVTSPSTGFNNAISFIGVTGQYIESIATPELNLTNNFTLEARITTGPTISGTYSILNVESEDNLNSYGFFISTALGEPVLFGYYHNIGETGPGGAGAIVLSANTTYNVALTVFDAPGYPGDTQAALYLNGDCLSYGFSAPIAPSLSTGTASLLINGSSKTSHFNPNFYTTGTTSIPFNGTIDEIRISNILRYPAYTNYTASNIPFNTDVNTVLLYHCDAIIDSELTLTPNFNYKTSYYNLEARATFNNIDILDLEYPNKFLDFGYGPQYNLLNYLSMINPGIFNTNKEFMAMPQYLNLIYPFININLNKIIFDISYFFYYETLWLHTWIDIITYSSTGVFTNTKMFITNKYLDPLSGNYTIEVHKIIKTQDNITIVKIDLLSRRTLELISSDLQELETINLPQKTKTLIEGTDYWTQFQKEMASRFDTDSYAKILLSDKDIRDNLTAIINIDYKNDLSSNILSIAKLNTVNVISTITTSIITVTTATPHFLNTNFQVYLQAGNYNGYFTIGTIINETQFTLLTSHILSDGSGFISQLTADPDFDFLPSDIMEVGIDLKPKISIRIEPSDIIIEDTEISIAQIDTTNFKFKLLDGLDIDSLYANYPWFIEAETDGAYIGQNSGGLVFYSGTWICGRWFGDTWWSGQWRTGEWYGRIWNSSLVTANVVGAHINQYAGNDRSNSIWYGGNWHSGSWSNGLWYGGNWSIGDWNNGIWFDGLWQEGNWNGGSFLGGVWTDGIWNNGVMSSYTNDVQWFGGEWNGGDFEMGTWYGGVFNLQSPALYSRFGTKANKLRKAIWEGGLFLGGEFHSYLNQDDNQNTIPSIRNDYSIWYTGQWKNGTWWGGMAYQMDWTGGIWNSGVVLPLTASISHFSATGISGPQGDIYVQLEGEWLFNLNDSFYLVDTTYNNYNLLDINLTEIYQKQKVKDLDYDPITNLTTLIVYNSILVGSTASPRNLTLMSSFENAIWNNGLWYGGVFNGKSWNGGVWFDGIMLNGNFLN